MDQERFDRIARTLASGQSRRGVLKGLTGTALGGLLAAVGAGEAGARGPCRAPNHKCGKGKHAQCCTSGQVCADGACTTPPPPDPCLSVDCDDRNECTTDICTPDGRCLHAPRIGSCDGGAGTCDEAGIVRRPAARQAPRRATGRARI